MAEVEAIKRPLTPLPWITRDGLICKGGYAPHVRCISEQDAEFVICAVNSYDASQKKIAALVEALRKNTIRLHGAGPSHNKWLRFDECQQANCVAARAAIKLAEEE